VKVDTEEVAAMETDFIHSDAVRWALVLLLGGLLIYLVGEISKWRRTAKSFALQQFVRDELAKQAAALAPVLADDYEQWLQGVARGTALDVPLLKEPYINRVDVQKFPFGYESVSQGIPSILVVGRLERFRQTVSIIPSYTLYLATPTAGSIIRKEPNDDGTSVYEHRNNDNTWSVITEAEAQRLLSRS